MMIYEQYKIRLHFQYHFEAHSLKHCIEYMFNECNFAKIDSLNTLCLFYFSFQTKTLMDVS